MINWKVTKPDMTLLTQIALRAKKLTAYKDVSLLTINMDVTACHLNGCPLKLKKLLKADDFNFAHDVIGISNHIDRETGTLLNCFLPRYAK